MTSFLSRADADGSPIRRRGVFLSLLFLVTVTATAVPSSEPLRQFPDQKNLRVQTVRSDPTGAVWRIETNRSSLAIQTDDRDRTEETHPYAGSVTWAVPCGIEAVDVRISNPQWRSITRGDIADSLWDAVLLNPLPLASPSSVMTMRGMNFVTVAFNSLQPAESGGGIRLCEQAEVELHYTGDTRPMESRVLSASFRDLARGFCDNLDDVVPDALRSPEPYLIIAHPAYATTALTTFADWKRARGHTVTVVTTQQIGSTNQQIKTYIQNAYSTWPEPPVFVLLVGDMDNPNPLPTWAVPGYYHPQIASDHPYTLVDGTDYLPDVFIGRFSVDNTTDLQTVINKCINYERNPFQPTGEWRRRMMITGVRSTPTQFITYNSAWPTLEWIGRQFLETADYSEIRAVPNPPGSASQISQGINSGVSFVAYRGYGSPSGWAYPPFETGEVNSLSNGNMLPFVTSIVCGGGAFESTVDPCFGEAWLRAGTPSGPKGAIGFIGPSEIDTKTRWNNTNIAGIYQGILFENVQTLAAAMLRGKLELFSEFPNNIDVTDADADRSVQFYFNCYNLLGDPGLTFFVGDVRDLAAAAPTSVPFGTPSITLAVMENGTPLPDVCGTIMRGTNVISRSLSDANGLITLPLPQDSSGDLVLTLTKPRHRTQQSSLALSTLENTIGARATALRDYGSHGSSGNGDGTANPGEHLAFGIVLHNYSSSPYSGGLLALSVPGPDFSILNGSAAIPSLAAGAETDTLWFLAGVSRTSFDGATGRLLWTITPGSWSWQTTHDIYAPQLTITGITTDGIEGNPSPLSTSMIGFQLSNRGRASIPAFSAVLHSEDIHLTVGDTLAAYPAILPGASVWPIGDGFSVTTGQLYPGDRTSISLSAECPTYSTAFIAELPIGNLAETDPSHPDRYGYRVFQDTDTAYLEAPDYAWLEIDPALGGAGSVLALPDHDNGYDTTTTIGLPFTFRFYGVPYTQVSVCSNGFIAFGQTNESYFRNYSLPAIASPDQMVCVFWDDMYVPPTGHICAYHDADGGRFIIEWNGLINQYSVGQEATFQLVLFDTSCWATRTGDGDILIQYKVFNNTDTWDNFATIGIQDRDQDYSLQVSYAGSYEPGVSALRSMQSLLFTTGRPEAAAYFDYTGNVIDDDNNGGSSGNGDGIAQNGETVQMQIRLTNSGFEPSSAVSGICRSLDPLAQLLDSNLMFNPIQPGQTEVSNPLRIRLSGQIPNRHVINFSMALGGNATPCVLLPSLQVAAPQLSLLPLIFNDDSIPPSIGNGNNELNPGETVELLPQAVNPGRNAAAGVRAILSCSDSRITLLNTVSRLGEIKPDSSATGSTPFVLRVISNAASGLRLTMNVMLTDTFGNQTSASQIFTVVRPALEIAGIRLNDPPPGGDGDLHLSQGEEAEIYPRVQNIGLGSATNVRIALSISDSAAALTDSVLEIGVLSPNAIREPSTPARILVGENGQIPRTVRVSMTLTADDGILTHDAAYLTIGDVNFYDDFETDRNYWSVYGTPNSWHSQTRESHSPTHAFYCGDPHEQEYPPNASMYLRSPIFSFPGHGALTFWTRYDLADPSDRCIIEFQTGSTEYQILGQFTGTAAGWEERYYSLDGLPATEDARIRFRFVSNYLGQAEGWYVDDVIILDEDLAVPPTSEESLPADYLLTTGFPNPFNERTTIQYHVPRSGPIRISLYNIQGRRLADLVNETKEPGIYRLSWQPISVASGVYLIHLEAGQVHLTGKLIYLK